MAKKKLEHKSRRVKKAGRETRKRPTRALPTRSKPKATAKLAVQTIRIVVIRDKKGHFARKTLPKRQRLKVSARAPKSVKIELVRDKKGHFARKTLPERRRWAPPVAKPVRKKPVKKPVRKPVKPVRKKPLPKKKPKFPKRRFPTWMAQAKEAEVMMQEKLVQISDLLLSIEGSLSPRVKSFINKDATVDAELRIGDLPDEWRTVEGLPLIVAAISEALRAVGPFPTNPSCGGAFWISFGLRFGPKDMADMMEWAKRYKRFKGFLQLGAYHTSAQSLPAMLNNALALRMFVERLWQRHNLPPVQLLIRFVWTPTKVNPGREAGEEGETK